MRLYDYWRSTAAYRVRIALHMKGLEFEQTPIDLRAGGQRAEDYLAVNPQGLIPFFVDGDLAIGQSLAIIDYLEETHPEPAVLPADPKARARSCDRPDHRLRHSSPQQSAHSAISGKGSWPRSAKAPDLVSPLAGGRLQGDRGHDQGHRRRFLLR